MEDGAERKAAMRAVWSRRQRYKHDPSSSGKRGNKHPQQTRKPRKSVAEQRDRYSSDGLLSQETVDKEDYEEWLSLCPKEPPEVLLRQRTLLPDVDFLRKRNESLPSVCDETGGLNLQYIASVLQDGVQRMQDLLDIPDDTMRIMFGEVASAHTQQGDDEEVGTVQAALADENDAPSNGEEPRESGSNVATIDDVLAAAVANDLSLNDHPVSRDEQDDLDAWFDAL